RMKCLVQAQPRIDIAGEFVGLGDNRFESRADECVAVRLAAGQRTRVAAQKWQVRSEFLAKRHKRPLSNVITTCAVFGDGASLLQPWKDCPIGYPFPPQ